MKSNVFMFVMLADQIASRTGPDRVPEALGSLDGLLGDRMVLRFERTTGDEIQGLTSDSAAVVDAICVLTRLGGWRIGIGAGEVDLPLPASTRQARGQAYLAARDAIGAARYSPTDLSLRAATVGAGHYGDTEADAETALWLLRTVLSGRSQAGWELVDLLDQGLSNTKAAAVLGISPSAASQRLARAHRAEATRGAALAARLVGKLHPGGGER